jgi:hypothetical protein
MWMLAAYDEKRDQFYDENSIAFGEILKDLSTLSDKRKLK